MKIIVIFMVLVLCCFGANGQGWFNLRNGSNALNANATIYALCSDDSNNIYAAGDFTDSITTSGHWGGRYVAKWSATNHTWSELGAGSNKLNANSEIFSICIDKFNNVYCAGVFTDSVTWPIGHVYVAKWNNVTGQWSELGNGINPFKGTEISTLCIDDSGNVYAAGNILDVSGYREVAKWNGVNWSELGFLGANANITSICVDDSFNVYAAGDFSDYTGRQYVAKYSHLTGNWNELGTGFDSTATGVTEINPIAVDSSQNVYAAVFANTIFKWNGTTWNQLPSINANIGLINSICLADSGFVLCGGGFTDSNGYEYVAKYNPQTNSWSELGTRINPIEASIFVICIDNNFNVYAAGELQDSISITNDYYYVAEYALPPEWLGIHQLQSDSFQIYPIPANDEINIQFIRSQIESDCTYTIYDFIGKVYLEGKLNNSNSAIASINVSGLPTGLYLLQINNIISTTYKIIKN